ncbi:MAG: hypothetical protein JRN09_08565 [Nitrososphaerota archaeon]|nr:hypothetical protein [Nitrososphaerota archaeon]
MATIRVWDIGMPPIVKQGYEKPHERGGYYEYEGVSDAAAKYWNALPEGKKSEVILRAFKERKDFRELIESLAA